MKNNLYICFKGKTFYWWNSVLSPEEKPLVKHGEKVGKWEQTLLKRWKKIPFTVMVTIKNNQYTMEDVRKNENLWNSFWPLFERLKRRICLCIIISF